jgi:hypothetical protein
VTADSADELYAVRLLNLPAELFVDVNVHLDQLLYELQIVLAGEAAGTGNVPPELSRVTREILDRYGDARATARAQAAQAIERGTERVDIELVVPAAAADASEDLLALLEQADELSRAGHLLVVPASPQAAELRRWISAELAAQLRLGQPPRPCPL